MGKSAARLAGIEYIANTKQNYTCIGIKKLNRKQHQIHRCIFTYLRNTIKDTLWLKKNEWYWNVEQEESQSALKQQLMQEPWLKLYTLEKPIQNCQMHHS